jgi:hypothetical protein
MLETLVLIFAFAHRKLFTGEDRLSLLDERFYSLLGILRFFYPMPSFLFYFQALLGSGLDSSGYYV